MKTALENDNARSCSTQQIIFQVPATNYHSTGLQKKKISWVEPVELEAYQHQKDQKLSSKEHLNWKEGAKFYDIPLGIAHFSHCYSGSTLNTRLKMSYLKTLLTGKAMWTISWMGYFAVSIVRLDSYWRENLKDFMWSSVQESLRKASQVKPHESSSLIKLSVTSSNCVNLLKENRQIGDLPSISMLYMAVDMMPQKSQREMMVLIFQEKHFCRTGFNFLKVASETRPKKHK